MRPFDRMSTTRTSTARDGNWNRNQRGSNSTRRLPSLERPAEVPSDRDERGSRRPPSMVRRPRISPAVLVDLEDRGLPAVAHGRVARPLAVRRHHARVRGAVVRASAHRRPGRRGRRAERDAISEPRHTTARDISNLPGRTGICIPVRARQPSEVPPIIRSCCSSSTASPRAGRPARPARPDLLAPRGRIGARRPVGLRQVDDPAAAEPARRPGSRDACPIAAPTSASAIRGQLRREVCLVPQLPALIEGTVARERRVRGVPRRAGSPTCPSCCG